MDTAAGFMTPGGAEILSPGQEVAGGKAAVRLCSHFVEVCSPVKKAVRNLYVLISTVVG